MERQKCRALREAFRMPYQAPTFRPRTIESRTESRRRYDDERREREPWRKWYGLQRWKRLRRAELERQPNCERCDAEGVLTEATVVNHRDPHRGDEAKFWAGPFECVCDWHHNAIIQSEEKRRG